MVHSVEVTQKQLIINYENSISISFFLIFLMTKLFAKADYFNEGVNLFYKEKFEKAQFKFEQDIVFNPKRELSYLYLSKIFNKLDKKNSKNKNLNTVMLLNQKTKRLFIIWQS